MKYLISKIKLQPKFISLFSIEIIWYFLFSFGKFIFAKKKNVRKTKHFYRDVDKQRIPLYIEETHWFSLKQMKLHFMDCICINNSNSNSIHNDGKSFGLFFCSVPFYALQLKICISFYNKPDNDDAILKFAITKQQNTI